MPNLELEVHKLSASKCFANINFSNAYWQMPLAKKSQEFQTFLTPDGLYTPTSVLHDTKNAVTHLQSSMDNLFTDELPKYCLSWLANILYHVQTLDELMNAMQSFLKYVGSTILGFTR